MSIPMRMTLLSNTAMPESLISTVNDWCVKTHLSVDAVNPARQLGAVHAQALSIEGRLDERQSVELRMLANTLNIDIICQVPPYANYKLACFDMDSTLIDAEVIDELAKEAGVGDQVASVTEQAMRGELDFNDSFRHRLALLQGLDESILAEVANRLVLNPGVEALMQALHKRECRTIILSGGFDYFAEYLQKKLGFHAVYANRLDAIDGKLTGKAVEPIVNAERKAELLSTLAQDVGAEREEILAVGDGANDLLMLASAGTGIAYKAKPLVQDRAQHTINIVGLDGIVALLNS